jgi:glutamine synthetase
MGSQPPKGQQLEDHYFGSIPSRVLSFMAEMEYELFKLGVPVKTRHNEVAPSQFEVAPVFEEANVATDHNQVIMEVLRKVALRHNFSVLLHEKPFAGVNGSGKHNNWSMSITASGPDLDGENLLEPGKTPKENLRFLICLAAVLKGVHKHGGMLRAGIATSGNDHRLGANEAPPAIISAFLGNMLSRILDEIESGKVGSETAEAAVIRLGVSKLPEVSKDNTDRNRTSPFAFTGNKFEFRAVGSSASTALPVTLINSAVADGFAEVTSILKEKMKTSAKIEAAILETVRDIAKQTKAIRFEGNGYSEEWVKEAEKRGLPNLKKTPEALAQLVSASTKKVLVQDLEIFSEAELHSRYHVRLERYLKDMSIEIDTLRSMVDTIVLPSAYRYHAELASGVAVAKAAGVPAPAAEVLSRLTSLIQGLATQRSALDNVVQKMEAKSGDEEKAKMVAYDVAGTLLEVRRYCDELETIIADDQWPLPKYREMLFIS